MLLATVPAAPPTRKNQRTTSWPAPISANVPYQRGSILILSALEWVSIVSSFTGEDSRLIKCLARERREFPFQTIQRWKITRFMCLVTARIIATTQDTDNSHYECSC